MRLVTNKWQRRSWGDDVAGLVILTVVGAIVGFITAGVLARIAGGFFFVVLGGWVGTGGRGLLLTVLSPIGVYLGCRLGEWFDRE